MDTIDVFLVNEGVIRNIVVVQSLEQARALYPDSTVIQRTDVNVSLSIGDVYA